MSTYLIRLLKTRPICGTTTKFTLTNLVKDMALGSETSIRVHEDGTPSRSRLSVICITLNECESILKNEIGKGKIPVCRVDGTYKLFEDYLISVRKDSDVRYDVKNETLYVCGYPIHGVGFFGTLGEDLSVDVHYYGQDYLKSSDLNTINFFKQTLNDAIIFASNAVYNSKRSEVIVINGGKIELPTEVTYPEVFTGDRLSDSVLLSIPKASAYEKSDGYVMRLKHAGEEDDDSKLKALMDTFAEDPDEDADDEEDYDDFYTLNPDNLEKLRLALAARGVPRDALLNKGADNLVDIAISLLDGKTTWLV